MRGTSCTGNHWKTPCACPATLPDTTLPSSHAPFLPPTAQYYGLTVVSLGHMMHTMFRDRVLPPAGLQPCDFFSQVRPSPRALGGNAVWLGATRDAAGRGREKGRGTRGNLVRRMAGPRPLCFFVVTG